MHSCINLNMLSTVSPSYMIDKMEIKLMRENKFFDFFLKLVKLQEEYTKTVRQLGNWRQLRYHTGCSCYETS